MALSRTSLMFSAAAAARILGVKRSQIIGFRVWAYVCWIHVRGQRPTMLSKKAFYRHFAEHRQQAGQQLRQQGKVSKIAPTRFTVDSHTASDGFYLVDCHPDRVVCTCDDYTNQVEFIGRGVCKHGYAVLAMHGFGSFAAYTSALGKGGYLRKQRRRVAA